MELDSLLNQSLSVLQSGCWLGLRVMGGGSVQSTVQLRVKLNQ